ncbi:MAG: molecular chaperone DnaJ [Pseudomonadota bacterium]
MAQSLYDALGVPKTASQDELKKAYRKLARELHPDRNPGDEAAEARFKEVSAAYEVLKDPERRKQYDQFGSANGRGGFDPGAAGFDFGGVDLGDLGDLFGGIFGGARAGRARSRPQKGADLEAHVTVSFDDALRGVETRIPVEATSACRTCHGSGAKPGTAPRLCPECDGRGVKAESQGLFALSQPCPRCRGNGTVIDDPCPTCHGSGREQRTKRYAVKIPPGARDGMRLRLKGKGEPGQSGGPNGDLDVVVRVERSDTYERRGDDLVVDVPVSFPTAALGGTVEVPTPDGAVSLKVPAGSVDGKLLRIRGRGAPHPKGHGKGDVLARVRIQVPQRVNKKERELLEQLQRAIG